MSRTLLLSLFLLCSAFYGDSIVLTADGDGAFSIAEVNDDNSVAFDSTSPDGDIDICLPPTANTNPYCTKPNVALGNTLFLATSYHPAYHPIRAPPTRFLA